MEKFKILNADSKEQSEATGNEYLWKAVLSRAAEDAFLMSCNTLSAVRAAEQALWWFLGCGQDFKLICEHAGRNPVYVYQKTVVGHGEQIKKRKKYLRTKRKEIQEKIRMKKIESYNKKYKTYFTSIKAMRAHMATRRKIKDNRYRRRIQINGKRYELKGLARL